VESNQHLYSYRKTANRSNFIFSRGRLQLLWSL